MIPVLLRAMVVTSLLGFAAGAAMAQKAPPTPFTGIPNVPKTLPLLGRPSADGLVLSAATEGNADGVAYSLAEGGSPDETDSQGRTALMHAAMTDAVAVANVLVAHAAALDARDKLGDTALHWAAQTGSVTVLRLLIALHVPVDMPDSHGMTPLMLAAGNNKPEAVRALLQSHADPKKTDYTGHDALSWAGPHPRVVALLETATTVR